MSRRKEVLILGKVTKPSIGIVKGGISKHIQDLSENLIAKNITVTLWDFRWNRSFFKTNINMLGPTYIQKALNFLYAVFILAIFTKRKYNNLSLKDKIIISVQIQSLVKLIKKNNFKVVHVHSLHRPVISILRDFFPSLKIVVTDHGFWQNTDLYGKDKERTVKKLVRNINAADRIITISKFAHKKFEEYGFSTEKTCFLPNPVNISKIPYLNTRRKKEVFFNGFSESLTRKNLPKVVEALNSDAFFSDYTLMAIVNEEGCKFLKQARLNFKVKILSAQPWNEVVKLYNQSKILVVPSKSESFGLVYLEALAIGTPVIGFHETVEEFREVLQTEEIGDTYNDDVESIEDLAKKIKKVLTTEYDTQKIRDQVKYNYDWDHKIYDFIKCYGF